MNSKKIEVLVGIFMLSGIAAFLFLALQVVNVNFQSSQNTYRLMAEFDSIGGLKEGSPVKVGGVTIGHVSSIQLNKESLIPVVEITLDAQYDNFSDNSSVSILTSGLLGEQYIGLSPGFFGDDSEKLKEGDEIEDTHSALILEDLLGHFLYGSDSN